MMSTFPKPRSAGSRQRIATAGHAGKQAGVGLIEVLVAVLILSIGFLGVAALLATSLSTNNSAMARSMATISTYSILDAMRADRNNATGGSYNTGTTPIVANACPATDGTLKGANLSQWCSELAANLGAAATTEGQISCTSAGDCQVTVTFDDSRAGKRLGESTSNVQTIVTRAML